MTERAEGAGMVASQDVTSRERAGGYSLNRLNKVRQRLVDWGADVVYVRDTSDIRWLTGFDGVFDEEQAHALIVTADRAVLHTDSRYSEVCFAAAHAAGDVVEVDVRPMPHSAVLAEVAGEAACAIAIDERITLSEYRALEKTLCCEGALAGATGTGPRLLELADPVRVLRAVKDQEEERLMREAQAITDQAFSFIVSVMAPGMTERQVQRQLDGFMLDHGADALSFPTIVATGPHAASPHAIPGDMVLEMGQCVVLDFGAKAHGYCSDMTRTVFLGKPSDQMHRAYQTLVEANESVESALRPGMTGAEAHAMAETALARAGFEGRMGHGLGHGVGIDIHELPVLSSRFTGALAAGNVVTVEPGIYLPGSFGMRLEDCGIMTDEGFQVFTALSHQMVVL